MIARECRKFTQEYHKSFHDNAKYAQKILLHTLQGKRERASLSLCACLFMWATQRLQKQIDKRQVQQHEQQAQVAVLESQHALNCQFV